MAARSVLFVCTGNVFRSVTAEYALRAALRGRTDVAVSSAGTQDFEEVVPPEIWEHLLTKGLDVRVHRRRTITREIVDASDLVIAMHLDHRDYIRAQFGREAPLFLRCCGEDADAMPDIHDVVPNFYSNRAAGVPYLRATMDRIIELTPRLAGRLEELLTAPVSWRRD